MAGKRRQHTAEFKAQVVLSVLARGKRRYGRDLSSCLLFYGIVWVKDQQRYTLLAHRLGQPVVVG